jgi:hypothetical protein
MNSKLVNLTYEVQLQSGETLALPDTLTKNIGAGRWLITIQPVQPIPSVAPRSHDAFLNGYAPEDNGLYDDYQSR